MVEKNIEQKPKEEVIKIKKISEKYKEKKIVNYALCQDIYESCQEHMSI